MRIGHRTRRVDFRGSLRPNEFARYGRRTRWGGGRWKSQNRKNVYLSPYVEEPLNSKVIKSFVPELRSCKCFSCFEIPIFYVYMLWTFYVHFTYPDIWLRYIIFYIKNNLCSLEWQFGSFVFLNLIAVFYSNLEHKHLTSWVKAVSPISDNTGHINKFFTLTVDFYLKPFVFKIYMLFLEAVKTRPTKTPGTYKFRLGANQWVVDIIRLLFSIKAFTSLKDRIEKEKHQYCFSRNLIWHHFTTRTVKKNWLTWVVTFTLLSFCIVSTFL